MADQQTQTTGYNATGRGKALLATVLKEAGFPVPGKGNAAAEQGAGVAPPGQAPQAEPKGELGGIELRPDPAPESKGESEKPDPLHKNPRFVQVNEQKNAAQSELKTAKEKLAAQDEELTSLREKTARLASHDLAAKMASSDGFEELDSVEQMVKIAEEVAKATSADELAKLGESVEELKKTSGPAASLAERDSMSQELGYELNRAQHEAIAAYKSSSPSLSVKDALVLAFNKEPAIFQEMAAGTPPASSITTPARGRSNVGVGGHDKPSLTNLALAMAAAGNNHAKQTEVGKLLVRSTLENNRG